MLCIGKEETGTRYRVPVSLKTARSDCLVDILHGHLFGEAQIFQGTPITDIISVIQGTGHLHKDKAESQTILDMFISEKKTFAIEYEGKVIGSLGVENYNEDFFPELAKYKGREIGCALSKDYWGKGLMPEAVTEVIRYLFEDCGLDFVTYLYFLHNKQSARVQEKCGFHFVKAVKYTRQRFLKKAIP